MWPVLPARWVSAPLRPLRDLSIDRRNLHAVPGAHEGPSGLSRSRVESLNDPRHWRERAEEARSRADQIAEPQSKNAMLRIAHDYEVLAERAEARASGHSLKSD